MAIINYRMVGIQDILNWITKIQPQTLYLIGVLLLFFSIALSFYALFEMATIILSFGIASILGGISIKSQMAIEASGKMMEAIVSFTIGQAMNQFGDRRLQFRKKAFTIFHKMDHLDNYSNSDERRCDKLDYQIECSFSIWKCRVYLRLAYKIFGEYMTPNLEKSILHQVNCLFKDLCNFKSLYGDYTDEDIRYLDGIFHIVSQFETFHMDTKKNRQRRRMIETNLSYIKKQSEYWLDWELQRHY
jgi:hypothetical protein